MARTSVDTNVLVRLITQDDPDQLERSEQLLASADLVILPTVLLETEWVLRCAYRYANQKIAEDLSALLSLPMMTVVDEDRILKALEWFRAGMDFADALNLAGSADFDEFVTFDRDFARQADAIPVRLL